MMVASLSRIFKSIIFRNKQANEKKLQFFSTEKKVRLCSYFGSMEDNSRGNIDLTQIVMI